MLDFISSIYFLSRRNLSILFIYYLFEACLQEMSEVLDGVVSVLMESSEQLLQTFLHSVGVRWILVQSICKAGHWQLLLLVYLNGNFNTYALK